MSVCRKLPDGTIQKIAGHTILLDANASEIRQGSFTLRGAADTSVSKVITFTDPMPDTDYVVIYEYQSWGAYPANTEPSVVTCTGKTTTGFTAAMWCYAAMTGDMNIKYTAFKPIKLEGYTALQNKVNSPDDIPTIDSMNLVTSDGVARAIENASAVWKGTRAEWNALPAADKKKYDLAVLLDKTLVKAVDRETGDENDVANLNKVFRGTEAEWQALSAAEKDEYDEAVTTGEQNPVAWPFPHPDWANAVAITAAQIYAGYTAPSDGMLVCTCVMPEVQSNYQHRIITVNNIPIAQGQYVTGMGGYSYDGCSCPVSEGDLIKSNMLSAWDSETRYFVPWKQA